jgi:hypothetical protein
MPIYTNGGRAAKVRLSNLCGMALMGNATQHHKRDVTRWRRRGAKSPRHRTTASSELMLNATGDDASVALHGSAMAPDGTGVHRDAMPQANAQRRQRPDCPARTYGLPLQKGAIASMAVVRSDSNAPTVRSKSS